MKELKEKIKKEIKFSQTYFCTSIPYHVAKYHEGRISGLRYILTLVEDGIDNSCCKTCGLFISGEDEYGKCSSNKLQCHSNNVCKRWRFK